MSYVNPIYQTIDLGSTNYVSGAGVVLRGKGPKGRSGRVDHAEIDATTTFTNVTTPGFIRIGTAADPDAYFEMDAAATAAGAVRILSDDTNAVDNLIAADTLFEVAIVAPTGGTPAGVGRTRVVIAWI